jgi:magnesium chelatase family protein
LVSKVKSCAINGISAHSVIVEAHTSNGLPNFSIIGLPDASLRESKDRVKTSIQNSLLNWPRHKVTINLSPANVKKHGAFFDLAIAIAILIDSEDLLSNDLERVGILGELMLNGKVMGSKGVLIAVEELQKNGCEVILVPHEYYFEASLVPDCKVIPVRSLLDAWNYIRHGQVPETPNKISAQENSGKTEQKSSNLDFVIGQAQAKLGITIAAGGRHNLLMLGEPGVGKSLLASCIPSLLKKLDRKKAVESSKVLSLISKEPLEELNRVPPFRSPHHSISLQGLLGGGSRKITPGEVTFAHNGILFLDELGEFSPKALDSLRQILESKRVTIIRQIGAFEFPANFMLIGCSNPCPCGYGNRKCICSDSVRNKYLQKISGPFFDRCDLVLHLEKPNEEERGLTYEEAKEMIETASKRQEVRYKKYSFNWNSSIPINLEDALIKIPESSKEMLSATIKDHDSSFSMRGISRIKKVSRTIADLYDRDSIQDEDVALAMSLRNF